MAAMEGTSLMVGILVGCALGAAASAVFFMLKARASAQAIAAAEQAQVELTAARAETVALRTQAGAAQQGEAGAKASLAAAQEQVRDLRAQVDAERQRAEQEAALRSKTQQELRATEERISERESAMQKLLAEREKSIVELKASIDQSKASLTETFKATGADVLKQTAEQLLRQAKEQYESHHKLSQQELEARQKAIDATLAPLKEQLAKSEQLVKELGEKREGDVKALGEQLKQIAELQHKASSAASTLSSALRNNTQRGRWGEVSLRNIAEMAGLVDNVDFSEQTSIADDEGNRLRPDMTVRLPGGRFVPIDAKVPMTSYLESLDPALSDADRAARRSAHAQALRNHVRGLSSREYAKALGEGVEITVLFVPFESGLIAALEEDKDLYEDAMHARVIICTSSTLLALLRTCALQWQQAKLNENARRIGESAKELLTRISTFAEHLEKVGKGLESATKGYNSAVASFNSRLLPGARDTAELAGDLNSVPDELEPANTALREVSARALPAAE
jgi:DNA recombination protein RmuC